MDKEKIITIVIGLAVGALLAGGYFFGNKLLPRKGPDQTKLPLKTAQNKVSPTPQPTITFSKVEITSPDNFSSTTKALLNLTGKSQPKTQIVIFANADEKVATPSATGDWQTSIKLEEGENEISATQISPEGKIDSVKRNVTLEISE